MYFLNLFKSEQSLENCLHLGRAIGRKFFITPKTFLLSIFKSIFTQRKNPGHEIIKINFFFFKIFMTLQKSKCFRQNQSFQQSQNRGKPVCPKEEQRKFKKKTEGLCYVCKKLGYYARDCCIKRNKKKEKRK